MEDQSFLLTLREAARTCPDVLIRKLVKDAADDLQQALAHFAKIPSPMAAIFMNSMWARAQRALDKATTSGGDGSNGGSISPHSSEWQDFRRAA